MSKVDFAKVIISKLDAAIGTDPENMGTPELLGTAMALGITEYITTRVKIQIAWTGISATGPDPLVTDTVLVLGVCSPIPSAPTFEAWIKGLEANIVSGFFVGPGLGGVLPSGTFNAFLPGLVITAEELGAAVKNHLSTNPQTPFWETLCGKILEWLMRCTIPGYPGIHGPYTGAAAWTMTIT